MVYYLYCYRKKDVIDLQCLIKIKKMAKNKHSYRRNKMALLEDNDHKAPKKTVKSSNTHKETKKVRPNHDRSLDIDIDKIIENHKIEIFVSKVVAIIILIYLIVDWGIDVIIGEDYPSSIFKRIIIFFLTEITALAVSFGCLLLLYKLLVKWVVWSIDTIKYYRYFGFIPKFLNDLFIFRKRGHAASDIHCAYKVKIGKKTVKVSQFRFSKTKKYSDGSVIIYEGIFFEVDIKKKSIPEGIWLTCTGFYHVREGLHKFESGIFTLYVDNLYVLNNFNKDVIFSLAERIYKDYGSSFVLYFGKGVMYFIDNEPYPDIDDNLPFKWNFIETSLRADLETLQYTIDTAEILASL